MSEPDQGQLAQIVAFLLGGGGFVAFLKWAFTQWMTDRKDDRVERKTERDATLQARDADRASLHAALFEIHLSLAAMLERDRIRDERRKRETAQPPHSRSPVPRGQFPQGPDDVTDIVVIKDRLRAEAMQPRRPTPPVGVRLPTRGGHHDGED